jgi:endogenous inhibitor of DNA gyrase (YacG/DUF329 family)
MGIAPRQRVEPRPCQTCGTTFKPRDNSKSGRFCSRTCADQAQRKVKVAQPCEMCGAMFTPDRPSRVARFCSKKCSARSTGLTRRKPGGLIDPKGYVLVRAPEHPMASREGYVMEHRLVMAEVLGRMLTTDEVVHHRNGVKADNRVENLEVMPKRQHDRRPKPPKKPIECPHCGGMIALSGRARSAVAL